VPAGKTERTETPTLCRFADHARNRRPRRTRANRGLVAGDHVRQASVPGAGHADTGVWILGGVVFPSTDDTVSGEEEREMSAIADIREPASELERLIADLSESGLLVFVFGAGVGWCTAHLIGVTTPVFRGPADRRWWHVELGDDTASWTMDVRVDEITGVRFVRGPYPFPSFPGREVLTVQFLGPGGETALHCYVHDLYDGQRMRPEKLEAWRALRERYGNRDESRVDQGTLLTPAA
jgi:putative heme iron utilization protein